MEGKSSASRSRSAGGNALMAASISATVLILAENYSGACVGQNDFEKQREPALWKDQLVRLLKESEGSP
jgi:hypothetical protein